MAKAKGKTGPATKLLEMVFTRSQGATSHSWERLNTAMRKALALAIGAGFTFVKGDFAGLDAFRSSFWLGDDEEWCYSMAVAEGNYSAADAFEAWKGRAAIIADNVTPADRNASFAHMSGPRAKDRLHVGCCFDWQSEKVTVTSFTEQGAAVACAYQDAERRKVKKRFTITRDLVIQDRAERKQRESLITELGGMKDKGIDFQTEFGVKTMRDLRALPFKQFFKIASAIKARAA